MRIAAVYPPIPKNAECPIEICPVNPSTRLSDIAAIMRMKASENWPMRDELIWVGIHTTTNTSKAIPNVLSAQCLIEPS